MPRGDFRSHLPERWADTMVSRPVEDKGPPINCLAQADEIMRHELGLEIGVGSLKWDQRGRLSQAEWAQLRGRIATALLAAQRAERERCAKIATEHCLPEKQGCCGNAIGRIIRTLPAEAGGGML